jgi:hypothetical protein
MNERTKAIVRQFVEQDCAKFAGILQIYIRLIETKIPYAENPERAQGIADAVAILQDGVDKAEEIAKSVIEGDYKKLEEVMAKEGLPPFLQTKAN